MLKAAPFILLCKNILALYIGVVYDMLAWTLHGWKASGLSQPGKPSPSSATKQEMHPHCMHRPRGRRKFPASALPGEVVATKELSVFSREISRYLLGYISHELPRRSPGVIVGRLSNLRLDL